MADRDEAGGRPRSEEPPEAQPPWRRSIGDALVVAVAAVAVVLGAAAVTGFLPEQLQRLVFHTPLAIGFLVVGTGWLLWRITRRPARDR